MKKYKVYERGEWYDVDQEFLEGIIALDQISFLELRNDSLKVECSNDDQIWYHNCRESWGFLTIFE